MKRSIATIDMGANAGREIAIIGGGIGGLTAALAFAQTGANTTVYEQATALTEVGAGLQITPNGARVLHELGLATALNKKAITASAVCPMDALTGRQIACFGLKHANPAYRFFHRADLIAILADACKHAGVRVCLNAHIAACDTSGQFALNGKTIQPTLTIGADGLHSVLRPLLNAGNAPFFTGQVAWRAIIDIPDAEPVARIWMAPGGHVVTYPLRGGRLNIVAVQERDMWTAEGWHHEDDPAHLRQAFANVSSQLKQILDRVEQVNLWGLFRHPVAEHWFGARTAILGDAAHPTLPFLAQGANLALEDAFVLAACCDADSSHAHALLTYQNMRKARVARAIDAATTNARNYHLSGFQRRIAHAGLKALGQVAPGAFINRLGWLYDYDATQMGSGPIG